MANADGASAIAPVSTPSPTLLSLTNVRSEGNTNTNLVPEYAAAMDADGWSVSKETIMRAFDLFLAPGCRYSGQLAEAVGDEVSLFAFPIPTKHKSKW
ncbi:hypothetical protein FB45DRAFT_1035220 [Roridomyces roridus]|uniref:Uncharacterized protein n=1 Tax=Roridomyces roridus TaxID=1738132 RepID=A0AAD7FET0_9AGAR|nr:hypothetical protein FB45DRAFT_1035220 [Roridomyces roridus]